MARTHIHRWWRHLRLDTGDVPRLVGHDTLARIEAQVAASEQHHTGEIRVCVEASLPSDLLWQGIQPRARAVDLFSHLRVWDTEANNGVLIYVLLADQAIEVVADRGLSSRVAEAKWTGLVQLMRSEFRQGAFDTGLTQAVATVDQLLRSHFPVTATTANPNELPNTPLVL